MQLLKTQSTDGVTVPIHTLQRGNSSRAPILLVHATGFHGLAYSVLAEQIRHRTDAPILAPDLRGHGDAPSPQHGRYSWDAFAEDLAAVVDAIDGRQLTAFGHSMGAATLLRVEQLRPGTFAKLYLFEPIVFPSDFRADAGESPLVAAARRRRSTFDSFEAAIDRFGSKPPLDALDPRCLRDYVEHGFQPTAAGEVELKMNGAEEAEVFRMSLALDTWDHLGHIAASTTIGYGRITGPGPAALAPRIAERLARGTGRQYSDLGHFGPLEDPALVANDIDLEETVSSTSTT